MKVLFVHQNFPGQYLHLARHLAAQPGNEVVCITQRRDMNLTGVRKLLYEPRRAVTAGIHHYLRGTESAVLNGQEVARLASQLRREGFVPDLMVGHNGWGEIRYLKDVFPDTPLLGYFEYLYRLKGGDVGFEPSDELTDDTGPRVRTRNAGNLIGLDAVDRGQSPTYWQRSRYPERYQPLLSVIHDGIDTAQARPDANARLWVGGDTGLPGAPEPGARGADRIELRPGDEVVTFVARILEPYRGFPTFMRSLPAILRQRPRAHVVIVGGDKTSYGRPLPEGQTHRAQMLAELAERGDTLDLNRVHFMGRVPYETFLSVLKVSAVHVYLTYPFVLSWSMLEAMASGCLVVGSNTPPVEEMLRDGRNGLIVDFHDPEQVAEAVVQALARPSRYLDIRQQARRTVVEQYDLASVCLPAQMALVQELVA